MGIKSLLITLFIIASTTESNAIELNQNLIGPCTIENRFFKRGCELKEGDLFPSSCHTLNNQEYCVELKLKANYSFPCESRQLFFSSIKDRNNVTDRMVYNGSEAKITGFGPFSVFDANPTRSREAGLFLNCNLVIKSATIELSLNSIRRLNFLKDQQSSLLSLKDSINASLELSTTLHSILSTLNIDEILLTLGSIKEDARKTIDSINEKAELTQDDHDLIFDMQDVIASIELQESASGIKNANQLLIDSKSILQTMINSLSGYPNFLDIEISKIQPEIDILNNY